MEIKLQCNCGTKFKFEFEPVNGRVPFAVNCPTCKADATEFANAYVAQQLGIATQPTSPVASAPAAASAAAAEPGRPKLRIGTLAPAAPPASSEEPAQAAPPPPSPRPVTVLAASSAYSNLTPEDKGLTPQFFYGLGGAVLGAAVGCGLWYLIFRLSGLNFRLFAVLVAAGGGFGARLLSKDEGSSQLGILTCVIVLCGIVFTAYTIGRDQIYGLGNRIVSEVYKEQVKMAKAAVKSVPTGSDDEIRMYLAKEEAGDDGKPDPQAVTAHDVRVFREIKLAQYKQMASGQVKESELGTTLQRWAFDERVADAKRAIEAVPNATDDEIRKYLKAENTDRGLNEDVTVEQVAEFKTTTLPEYQKLASGETQFRPIDLTDSTHKGLRKMEESENGGWMKVLYFFTGWGIGGIFLMFGTLGLAYKAVVHA